MKIHLLSAGACVVSLCLLLGGLPGGPPSTSLSSAQSEEPSPTDSAKPVETAPEAAAMKEPRVVAAREQAKLMHDIYASSLEVIHERYFRNDRSTVPARALEDVFRDLERQRGIQARWIGVNARTMSIPHEPKDEFERQAAAAIGKGKGEYEAVENGFYRRAGAIPLHAGCLTCHGSFGVEAKSPRFAGLVIRIPLAP